MFIFKKKNHSSENTGHTHEQSELKERLFFHDLINHTHGLLLFLNNKTMMNSGIDKDEMLMMEKEIKTLQSLIKDHYNFKHKNLVQTYDWVPFSYAKLAFANLCQTYLADIEVNASFSVQGDEVAEDLIYYPCFYRILNNLIKNIAESKCSQVDFSFVLNEAGMFVNTKNKLKDNIEDNSPEYLSRVILDEKIVPIKSMGLDSIHHMALEHGGSFSFEISNNSWGNHLFLPTQKLHSKIKSDKIPA